jgi:hypothetical protein
LNSTKIVETRQQQAQQAANTAQQAAPSVIIMAFSLSPAKTTNDVIDYATSDGMKLFAKATKPQKTEYDGSPDGLRLFLGNFKDHANTSNWKANITVATTSGDQDLASRYGKITESELATHVTAFNDTQTRLAQNSAQMVIYLKESLADNFKLEVYMNAALYTLAGIEVGELFLWQIIKLVNADTRATVGYIREALTMLPRVTLKLNSDVHEINKWINNQVESLTSRGHTSTDLMTNIFKAYAVVQDKQFVSYIADLKTQYEDGRIDMDADKLMMMGHQKFKNLGLAEVWEAPVAEKTDIVALATVSEEILALKTTIEQLRGQMNNKKKNASDGEKWAWKLVAPHANQAQSKQVNNKNYYWCPHHVKWCIHKPADCKGLNTNDVPSSVSGGPSTTTNTTTGSTSNRTDDSSGDASKRKLELTNAFNAFVQDSDDGNSCI